MRTRDQIRHRAGRASFRRSAAPALLVLLLSAEQGLAQRYVGQSGQLFDANPQIGANRLNFDNYRPDSPFIGGNPYATGNIGRGLSLRSFSPIDSPTAFRGSLGSSTLSNFMRDSVSVADQFQPYGGLTPRAFYDPVRTAPTASYLSGYYDASAYSVSPNHRQTFGPTGTVNPYTDVQPYGTPPARRLEPTDVSQASRTFTAPLNTELSSSIFGVQAPKLPGQLSGTQLQPPATYLPEFDLEQAGIEGGPSTAADGIGGPLDLRIWQQSPAQATPTPLDVISQDVATRLLTERTVPGFLESEQPLDAAAAESPTGLWPSATSQQPGGPALRDTSMLPGNDVFTDMQLALELSLNPQAEWYTEMWEATRDAGTASPSTILSEDPSRSVEKQDDAALAAAEFIAQVLDSPVDTFVGDNANAINEELRQAEAAMDFGRYYDAVRHYERVRILDPANPLASIGKGHALLAAGEYVSAALNLIAGLERFPEMARFKLNLTALMGGGEVVDIRRADLMQQLARNEDPQLRFLLGYLEIHTGNIDFGIKNLEKAASDARPGALIRRYPDLIRAARPALFPPPSAPENLPHPATLDAPAPGADSSPLEKEPQ